MSAARTFLGSTIGKRIARPVGCRERRTRESTYASRTTRWSGGRGVLIHDGRRDPFESGDVLFVAAGSEHHYEDFTEDLALWRVFYGPRGGEVPEREP
jgi:hypothetical protein